MKNVKNNICKRCKNRKPNFREYLAQIMKMDRKNDNWEYIYCRECGQYYYRESHSNNYNLIREGIYGGIAIDLLSYSIIINIPMLVVQIFILLGGFALGFFVVNWVRYFFTKFEKVSMKVSRKNLRKN